MTRRLRAAYGALGIGYRAWRWSYRNRLRRLRMAMDNYARVDALMADHPWTTGECRACGGDGTDHGLQEPERSMNPCPACAGPASPLERLNTPDVRAVLDGEGPA